MKIIIILITIFSSMYILLGNTSKTANKISKAIYGDISNWLNKNNIKE